MRALVFVVATLSHAALAANMKSRAAPQHLDRLATLLLAQTRVPASASTSATRAKGAAMQEMGDWMPDRTGQMFIRDGEVEKYVMTWSSKSEQIIELPTGGAASMKSGENLMYFRKKEQALALSRYLKTNFKIADFKVYRIYPGGEVQFIHPADGVPSEKVNAGRIGVGNVPWSIGKNPRVGKFEESNPNNKFGSWRYRNQGPLMD